MPEQLWFTEILNHLFAGPVTGLLRALHVQPQNPEAPITNAVAMQFLVFVSLVVLFALVRSRLSVDRPGALQHVLRALTVSLKDRAATSSDTIARATRLS